MFDESSYENAWGSRNQAVGVYTPQNQFNLDRSTLVPLGFSEQEISFLEMLVALGGKVTPSVLASCGLSHEESQRIKYMYDIASGKISLETTDDLVKHLRKLFGKHGRIGIQNLMLSKVQKVPRKAVVAGIKDETFGIYNSKNFKPADRMFEVVEVSGSRIHIKTSKKPVLKWKQSRKVDGVIELLGVRPDGEVTLAVNKEYSRLCNRFIVVASLRRPEFHHGMIEIICIEGTRVFVHAQTLGTKEYVSYSGGSQRVYDFGFLPREIDQKVIKSASELYKHVCGVYAIEHPANSDFKVLEPDKPQAEEESIDDMIED